MKQPLAILALLGSGILFSVPLHSADQKEGSTAWNMLIPQAAAQSGEENADCRAGDSAFSAGDYPVAVSFYTKYLQDCRKKKDPVQEKRAYERLLDALVQGKFTQAAQRYLAEYEKRFPENEGHRLRTDIWQGEILFQQGKLVQAERLYRNLLNVLPDRDPRRYRVMFTLGSILEKQKHFAQASEIFLTLWQQNISSRQSRKLFHHSILCLAAAKQWDKARDLLLTHPPAKDEDQAYALLEAYIYLQQYGAQAASGIWKYQLRSYRKNKDELWYITASSYGDAFVKSADHLLAQQSYRAAFHAAADNAQAQETLQRMIDVISAAGDIEKAAALAVSQLELFTQSTLKAELKLRTADLLRDSGKWKEALPLYESVFANITSTLPERRRALYDYALLLGKMGRMQEGAKAIRDNIGKEHALDGEYLLAEILVKLKNQKEFLRQYDKIALSGRENFIKSKMLCARACVDQSMPGEALSRIKQIRDFLKQDLRTVPDLYYIEAAAYTLLRNKEKALDLYRDFLRNSSPANKLYPVALYHAGTLAFLSGHHDEAIRHLSRLKKEYGEHPMIPEASVWLIQIQSLQNNEIYVTRETLSLAEKYPDSEYVLDCLFRLGQHFVADRSENKAIQVLSRLIANKRFPRIQARALYELARFYEKSGKREQALSCLNKLYHTFPEMDVVADAYYLHGDILRSNFDFTGAIACYKKTTALQKNTPLAAAALGSIGDCLYALGSADAQNSANIFQKAIRTYQAMLQVQDRPPVFDGIGYYRTGRCLEALGQPGKAAQEYLKVLYRFPAQQASVYPAATVWCVRAAEGLIDLAQRTPLRSTLTHARTALHWLCDAGLLKRQEAAQRFEKLKSYQFNP